MSEKPMGMPAPAEHVAGEEKETNEVELIAAEKKALEDFFGQNIEVPALPAEATPEKIENWEKLGFKLRYLPTMDIPRGNKYPGLRNELGLSLYKRIENGDLPVDSQQLKAGWLLVDERNRPNWQNNREQIFENDPFAETITELRKAGVINDYKIKGSRFNVSAEELDKPQVKAALAKVLDVEPEKLDLLRYVEFNILGNAFYPEWPGRDTTELFKDKCRGGHRLYGTCNCDSCLGLTSVEDVAPEKHWGALGFRPVVRF